MKMLKTGFILTVVLMFIVSLSACAKPSNQADALPLWENDSGHAAKRIVVISDLHLGAEDSFSQTTKNRPFIVAFLEKITVSDVDELVIDGDLLDEWFVPISYTQPTDLKAFFKQVAVNNASVIEAIEKVIKSGVKVTYIPGNHDMLLTDEILAELIPGINQARDEAGLGTYRLGMRSEIVIEHGHRYDTFNAPDPLSNKEITGDYPSIIPPGYFLTRMAATSVAEGQSAPAKDLPLIQTPSSSDADQLGAYAYYQTWSGAMGTYPISAGFNDKVISCGVDGYNNSFALSDLLPTVQEDGSISAILYANVQRQWDAIQDANGVVTKNPYTTATAGGQNHTYFDGQAVSQYFNVDPTIDVVVLGHTHVPVITHYTEGYNREKIYANTGTWVDTAPQSEDMTFVVIESGKESSNVQLMQYMPDGTISNIEQQ
ncbi:MAG: metallophosphoesterase [Acetobacterium woodii]|nr:metallophosphoesterase [Acetobacterium woodii]